jgi:hypothetical protein
MTAVCVGNNKRQNKRVSRSVTKPKASGLLILLALVTLSTFSGCAGVVGGAGPGKPGGIAASFQLTPGSVNFGNVAVGKGTIQRVSIANTGTKPINIIQASFSNPQFSFSGMATPMALATGQTGNFSIAVNPTAPGNLTGTLTVKGDGGSNPVVVDLSATGVSAQPQISLSVPSLDFGSVSVGLQSNSTIAISNSGGGDLMISVLTLTGGEFGVSGISTPRTIGAGQNANLTLTFHPTAAGAASGSLLIVSNDLSNPTITIPLTGTGSNTPMGQLSANPASVAFGNVLVGSNKVQQVTLTNSGNAAVKISSITGNGAGYSVSGATTPTTLSPAQATSFVISYTPASAGGTTGSVKIVSDASNSSLTINLSGTGTQAGLTVAPSSFNFGSIVDGQTKSQSVTLTNTGLASLTVAQLSVSGAGYSVSGVSTPATIASGQSIAFVVQFAPTTAGTLNGAVSIASNAPGSPSTVALTGTGVAASVSMTATPTGLSFGSISAGSYSSKSVTVTNNGNSSVIISQLTVNAKDVSTSGITTPLVLAAGKSATMAVSFRPASSETVTGNISLTSAQGTSTVIPVTGSGVQSGITATPSSAVFGNDPVGTALTQTIQITNNGTSLLTISQINASGSGFSTSTIALPVSLNAGRSMTFNIQFLPTTTGATSGAVSVISNAPLSPSIIAVSGTGISATQTLSISPTNLSFGMVSDGGSFSKSVTVTNTGNASVQIIQITPSGTGFSLNGVSAPIALAPSQSLNFNVLFSPSVPGISSGTVTISSNTSGSPATITLSGTGVVGAAHTVGLTWNPSSSTVNGYNVYRSTTSGSGYGKINSQLIASLSYTDSSVQNGSNYYYVTTAVDASGTESAYSNEALAIIP